MTNDQHKEGLLPCPFCGTKAILDQMVSRPREPQEKIFWHPRCPDIKCHGYASYFIHGWTKEDAIAAWNRRPTPSPSWIKEASNAIAWQVTGIPPTQERIDKIEAILSRHFHPTGGETQAAASNPRNAKLIVCPDCHKTVLHDCTQLGGTGEKQPVTESEVMPDAGSIDDPKRIEPPRKDEALSRGALPPPKSGAVELLIEDYARLLEKVDPWTEGHRPALLVEAARAEVLSLKEQLHSRVGVTLCVKCGKGTPSAVPICYPCQIAALKKKDEGLRRALKLAGEHVKEFMLRNGDDPDKGFRTVALDKIEAALTETEETHE